MWGSLAAYPCKRFLKTSRICEIGSCTQRFNNILIEPLLRQISARSDVWLLNSQHQDIPTPVLFKTQISIYLAVMANCSNNGEHESLTQGFKYETKFFFKSKRIKVIYKRDLESTSRFHKWNFNLIKSIGFFLYSFFLLWSSLISPPHWLKIFLL